MEELSLQDLIQSEYTNGLCVQLLTSSRFAAVNLDKKSGGDDYAKVVDGLAEDDESRSNFLKACLSRLGLVVSQDTGSVPSLSRLHLSAVNHHEVQELLASWEEIIDKEDGEEYIKGENDTFHIQKQESRWSLHNIKESLPGISDSTTDSEEQSGISEDKIVDYNKIMKTIIPHENEWPGLKETPHFNHHAYFAALKQYQEERNSQASEYGNYILYGDVVTSTNTILEKYYFIALLVDVC
jgi:biotin--protein ligase